MAAYHPAKENGTARLCFPSGTVFALSVKQVEFFGVLFQIKSLPITHVSVKRVKQKQNPGSVLSRDRTVTLPYKYQGPARAAAFGLLPDRPYPGRRLFAAAK